MDLGVFPGQGELLRGFLKRSFIVQYVVSGTRALFTRLSSAEGNSVKRLLSDKSADLASQARVHQLLSNTFSYDSRAATPSPALVSGADETDGTSRTT